MRILGQQFVMGEDIETAWSRSQKQYNTYQFSFDMLGEAALTQKSVGQYEAAYHKAIDSLAKQAKPDTIHHATGISIKLSALHPRFHEPQQQRVQQELMPRILRLVEKACRANLQLTIDAEESDRLDLTLDIFSQLVADKRFKDWDGLGIAVQAYQKRAWYVIQWLIQLAQQHEKHLCVRLVKGAYWDSEIKLAQEQGLDDYPVFTRKMHTDISYLACAQYLLQHTDIIYPQFATHNAYTIASILHYADAPHAFEFQRLHGMGENLYAALFEHAKNVACRVYAPVGEYSQLLPYLVRRLLENGANTSFVHRISDPNIELDYLLQDPVIQVQQSAIRSHQHIVRPCDIYLPERKNAQTIALAHRPELTHLYQELVPLLSQTWSAKPSVALTNTDASWQPITNPANPNDIVGQVQGVTLSQLTQYIDHAQQAWPAWHQAAIHQRAALLNILADRIEQHYPEFITLLVREAGKCLPDALAELREGVDFCRYYAALAMQQLHNPTRLKGPTGETNQLSLHGRGIAYCISPWNFPFAIFLGQISAALVAGNCVLAKPAAATPLVAARLVDLMHEVGIPKEVIQLVPGDGASMAEHIIQDDRIQSVLFTGSTATAKHIQNLLAQRSGNIIPLIAETGGINAMIVDSSALLEQVCMDILRSAFNSAGQRCSACRILYLQQDIADQFIEMLVGALDQWHIGQPIAINTDMGPLIDQHAQQKIIDYLASVKSTSRIYYRRTLPEHLSQGYFLPPQVIELDQGHAPTEEIFGPVLHIVRYQPKQLDDVIKQINSMQYGLTLGVHSRIMSTVEQICQQVQVGNIYINRNMIGATVGVQPFGGQGLSGTGPKAGGPHYLNRLMTARVITHNITAIGGNASLLSHDED